MAVRVRIITPNYVSGQPRRFAVLDTEAYRERHDWGERQCYAFGVAALYERDADGMWREVDMAVASCPLDLWRHITGWCHAKERLYLFAHNLDYDLQLSDGLRVLPSLGYGIKALYAANGRLLCRVSNATRTLVLVDSFWLLPASIETIGNMMGYPKLPMPAGNPRPEGEWLAYCIRDVRVLARAIQGYLAFLAEHDLGAFRPTISGQAFQAFRHRFMNYPLAAPRDPAWLDAERNAYRGGRVEAWRIGRFTRGPYYKLDVNSMYPYVMTAYPHPVRPKARLSSPDVRALRRIADDAWLLVHAMVYTPDPVYGIRKDGKLVFPVGRFPAWLCGEEVRYALRHGHIREVRECYVYCQDIIFDRYVDYFYGLRRRYRQEGNVIYDYICKLFLNGLYGKFGQHGYEQHVSADCQPHRYGLETVIDVDSGRKGLCYQLGDVAIEETMTPASYYAYPAVAASITAAARVHLWRLAKDIGPGHVYYMDTDSLIVDREGMARAQGLIDDSRLGALKVEDAGDCLEIRGAKDYSLGGRDKVKGLGKVIGEGQAGVPLVEKWRRLRGALREGDLGHVVIRYLPYTRRLPYDKGIVGRDGRVRPIRLYEPWPP